MTSIKFIQMSAIDTFTSSNDYYSLGNDISDAHEWIQAFEKHFGDLMRVLKQIINTVPKDGMNIDGIKILKHRQSMINDHDIRNNIELMKNGVVVRFSYSHADGLFVSDFDIKSFGICLANRIGTTDDHIRRFVNMTAYDFSSEEYVAELSELRDMYAAIRSE
jgi:hypothetical protein